MSSFSFLPKKDPKSSLLELIRSRVAIAIAPHFHTQMCTILTTLATKVARYLGIIFSRWFVFSRGIFVVLIDFNTARSVHLRWLNTVLAVCEYMSFAKSWQEKGCSSQAGTW